MNLVAEIGNSSIVIAVFNRLKLQKRFRIASHSHDQSDRLQRRVTSGLTRCGIPKAAINKIFIGSVVPPLTIAMRDALHALFGISPLIITPRLKLNIRINKINVNEIGIDIVANAVEAWAQHPKQAAIVVDFGTAVSIGAINDKGVMSGVAIAPGLSLALQSLVTGTAQLSQIKLKIADAYLGTNTEASLQSGIMYGYRGLINELVSGMIVELNTPACVFATGGASYMLHKHIPIIDTFQRDLTVSGLNRVGILNS